ncbi:hypothetical protein HRR83_005777 [Exophiala dermatitidis]|uniref:ATP-dependent DNA ligase family profile domain-containing protein n=1 Tax=Exophiala dermatitidis TaxID=5970 RepID=A0AAN6ENA1_EXODE|nr:hypothetical protein HRR73_007352 [Exophiala dermatitidis]KAJ4510936.1 hypothetical protein HRR75_005630 [Exophiala dermatitidis]KAJ4513333.1 hypothetical protein HRR74_006145 [Exophiala dermatitidis]KAJ4538115.1 hypothetical protein HRR77_007155 [Exophiala dermatitidis]KAJ4539851.1 hypothetical protein HRR76_003282 [Exophiala dermatitidis]
MGFKFNWLVELLDGLDAAKWQKPLTVSRAMKPEHQVVDQWFKAHGHQIPRHGPSAASFLACMFPERLSHRTYAMQEARLATIFGRILHLGTGRADRLRRWQDSKLDFSTCLEQIMSEAEMPLPDASNQVTLEEIDEALFQIAANSPFSSVEIRWSANNAYPHEILLPIVRRLQSWEAKWLVRMILKSYSPIQIPEHQFMQSFHFLLPDVLAIQNSLEAAVEVLSQEDLRSLPPNPPKELRHIYRKVCARYLVPKLGVMICRQPYYKARSIRHCCQMANQRSMSVERKYDGEYCQIHIDRSKHGRGCIQIFSKSGKNSTEDRVRLHGAIAVGLQLDNADCPIQRNCIVEGELLVWSRSKRAVQPFHVIRKHVMHGLRFLGAEADSPRKPDEQLMIMFYDILLLDDKVLTNKPHAERRELLRAVVRPVEGQSEIGYRNVIDFSKRDCKDGLRELFVHAINERWEGLVLKGCKDPYFSWEESSSVIKLKKDYIAGLGDTVDLCIVGGRREQSVVDELKIGQLSWTSFHLACLENRDEVRRFNAKPAFRLLDVLSYHNISKDNILFLNERVRLLEIPYSRCTQYLDVRIDQRGIRPPTALFKEPFVVEVMGAGFEKPSNTPYFVLRFPRALNIKLHLDRSLVETNTFEELQEMACKSMTPVSEAFDHDEAEWLQRLIQADGKGYNAEGNSQSTSPAKSSPGGGVKFADLTDHKLERQGLDTVAHARRPGDTGMVRFSSPVDGQNTSVRKHTLSIHISPSEEARKKRRTDSGVAAATISKHRSRSTASVGTGSVRRTLIPLYRALKGPMSAISPFSPPAVFRSPRKRKNKGKSKSATARSSAAPISLASSRSRHMTTGRHPLGELPNVSPTSPQRPAEGKVSGNASGPR